MLPQFCFVFEGVYNLTSRVKEIDPGYVVVWNAKTKRFELWHISFQAEFCMQLGEDACMPNIKRRVLATSQMHMKDVFEEVAKHNKHLEEKRMEACLEKSKSCLQTTLRLAELTSTEPTHMQMQKILEGNV